MADSGVNLIDTAPREGPSGMIAFVHPRSTRGVLIDDVPIIAGGIIPESDRGELKALGVRSISGPGTPTKEIVECVVRLASERQAESDIS